MAFRRIVADFETRSPVDIKDCGAYKYAQHPDTDVTMLAVLDIDNPTDVRMWIGPNFRHLYETEISDAELDEMVEKTFEGSLPAFVAAFTRHQKLSESEIDAIQKMIDDYRKGESK